MPENSLFVRLLKSDIFRQDLPLKNKICKQVHFTPECMLDEE